MSFKLFIEDKVEKGSKVKGSASKADAPTLGEVVRPPKPEKARKYPIEFFRFRQGTSLTGWQEKNSLVPLLGGGNLKIKDGKLNNDLAVLNLGQPKVYSDNPIFDDSIDIINKPEDYLQAPPTAYYPVVMSNPAYKHSGINLMDGVIEVFPIREALPNNIDSPYQIKDIKAGITDGNTSEYAGSDIITDFISKTGASPSRFLDSQDIIMESNNFKLADQGLSTLQGSHYPPFDETLIITRSLGANLTSSFRNYGINSQYKKSAIAGFEYFNNGEGTDSIAFGGLKKFSNINNLSLRNLPPKLILNNLYNKTGSIPTVRAGWNPNRMGNYHPGFFDDTKTLMFMSETDVQYPDMVNPAFNFALNQLSNSSPISVSSGGMKPGFDVKQRDPMMGTFSPNFIPFDESKIYLENSSFYKSGSLGNLRNLIQINIDITPKEEKIITRLPVQRTPPNSEFSVNTSDTRYGKSGFVYFSFKDAAWQDIGLQDPVTGEPIPYDYSVETDNTGLIISGTELFPMQFSNPPSRARLAGKDLDLYKMGYNLIGRPTNISQAPFHNKYYATSSQVAKMSNYLAQPFLIEKIVVDIPVVARRKQGLYDDTTQSDHTPMLVNGGARDIDNYVFFIYRQTKSGQHISDTAETVSGSQRFLICSASMSFVNSQVSSASLDLHSPTFYHDFNTPVSGSDPNAINAESSFTGSLKLEIVPGVWSRGFWGESSLPSNSGQDIFRRASFSPSIQNAWSGGTLG